VTASDAFEGACEYDPDDPAGYRCGALIAGSSSLGTELAVKVFELPPGERLCPYHYEYTEEWLLVLEGEVVSREPTGERSLARGSLVRYPLGPDGAHQVRNDSAATARVLMFSSAREPAVSVYPDSDKIGVWPGNRADDLMLRRADGARDYYDGEV
jgi:uncharacterized cupin superfamily protein